MAYTFFKGKAKDIVRSLAVMKATDVVGGSLLWRITMRAYILSRENGTVQIGDTVFQPYTHKKFKADRKGLSGKDFVIVDKKDFNSARQALRLMPDGGPTKENFEKREEDIAKEIDKDKEKYEDFCMEI